MGQDFDGNHKPNNPLAELFDHINGVNAFQYHQPRISLILLFQAATLQDQVMLQMEHMFLEARSERDELRKTLHAAENQVHSIYRPYFCNSLV